MKTIYKPFLFLKFRHKILLIFSTGFFLFLLYFVWLFLSIPKLFTVSDYRPPLLTQVYDREDQKVGEFFKERRLLFPYEDIPKAVIWAFVSAEDGRFFSHKGLNYRAIARAFMANLKAGRKVQGGSTITQQLARTLLLSTKKTYTRKIKEAILALRMENSLSKQDILYIYLNQIYLGHGAYGLEMASRTYFRKSVKEISVAEAALLAGLPKAPSRFSPVYRPDRAKSRQLYVLNRMRQESYISEEEMNQYAKEDLKVFVRRDFSEESPYYLETVRRILLLYMNTKTLLTSGLKIYTAMDLKKQKVAQQALRKGLEGLDKRQGFRGVQKHLSSLEEKNSFSKKRDKDLRFQMKKYLTIPGFTLTLKGKNDEVPKEFFRQFKEKFKSMEEEKFSKQFWFDNLEILEGKIFDALVSKVDEKHIEVLTPWGEEILELKSFNWAIPIERRKEQGILRHPNEIFKVNDVVSLRVKKREEFESLDKVEIDRIPLELYQEPLVEGSLLSFDLQNSEVLALIGGYKYSRSQYNRAYQSRRQAGSVFKPFVYGAALERGFNPSSLLSDSPVVFSQEEAEEKPDQETQVVKKSPLNSLVEVPLNTIIKEDNVVAPTNKITKENKAVDPTNKITKEDNIFAEASDDPMSEEFSSKPISIQELWRPSNINDRFLGDILFRKALVRSLNVPTVRIVEKMGIAWLRFYVRRLGIFSPLNSDFTMALGSSSLSLYETLKAFSVVANQGKALFPILVRRVEDASGKEILVDMSLDEFFKKEIAKAKEFVQEEKKKWFHDDILEEDLNPFQRRWQGLFAEDSQQLIPASNSYVLMNLLEAVVTDPEGTARRARVLKRPLGGKTGTTDGYYDTWFVGASPFISTAVWVGFDSEKTLGKGETGSRVALPIWMQYMKASHEELPPLEFPIPEQVVFANVDVETGELVSSKSKQIVHQAFIEGSEPGLVRPEEVKKKNPSFTPDETEFIREDLSR